jgi:hypothetical protein
MLARAEPAGLLAFDGGRLRYTGGRGELSCVEAPLASVERFVLRADEDTLVLWVKGSPEIVVQAERLPEGVSLDDVARALALELGPERHESLVERTQRFYRRRTDFAHRALALALGALVVWSLTGER